jgi:hypothetical protein
MKKSLVALAATIVVFLVYSVAESWCKYGLCPAITIHTRLTDAILFLPQIAMLLFVISFYLMLDELETRQVDNSLWATIRRLKIPPIIAVISVLLIAFEYVLFALFGNYELYSNFVFSPYFAIFLGIISVFLKINMVERGKVIKVHS